MNIRSRQDAVVRSLRRSGTATIAELASEIGVSRRTVLRDIAALRDEGFVIHSEPGRGGGLQLDPQSVQDTLGVLLKYQDDLARMDADTLAHCLSATP